jgi:stalled ribosome rescue protein Dom34
MKATLGVWIDHRKAVIVFAEGKEEIKVITAIDEKQHRQAGGSMYADDSRQREVTGHLNDYYDEVISYIRDAASILIFGPGEAKGELNKRLEKDNLSGRVIGIETSDKMTDPQIVAKVRDHFLKQNSAAG